MSRGISVSRNGWTAQRSNFYGAGVCANCNHDMLDHFWWVRIGEQELGCHYCTDHICKSYEQRQEGRSMSAVNLCERCDSLMLGSAVAEIHIRENRHSYDRTVEICPPCMSDLDEFMRDAPTREKHVYREPYQRPDITPERKELT